MDLGRFVVFLSAIFGLVTTPAAAVYGSIEVDIKAYPHHAAIEERNYVGNRLISSGAILAPKVIITTASAVNSYAYRPSDLNVRVGSTEGGTGSGGTVYEVAEVNNAPRYDQNSGIYDVAILILRRPITWTSNVRSINLSNANERPPYQGQAFLSSWGSYEAGVFAIRLRQATFNLPCRDTCWCDPNNKNTIQNTNQTRAPAYSPSEMLCATNGNSRGTCSNDDGAPLVFKSRLVGLATRKGFGCESQMGESWFVDLNKWENRYFIQGFL